MGCVVYVMCCLAAGVLSGGRLGSTRFMRMAGSAAHVIIVGAVDGDGYSCIACGRGIRLWRAARSWWRLIGVACHVVANITPHWKGWTHDATDTRAVAMHAVVRIRRITTISLV